MNTVTYDRVQHAAHYYPLLAVDSDRAGHDIERWVYAQPRPTPRPPKPRPPKPRPPTPRCPPQSKVSRGAALDCFFSLLVAPPARPQITCSRRRRSTRR